MLSADLLCGAMNSPSKVASIDMALLKAFLSLANESSCCTSKLGFGLADPGKTTVSRPLQRVDEDSWPIVRFRIAFPGFVQPELTCPRTRTILPTYSDGCSTMSHTSMSAVPRPCPIVLIVSSSKQTINRALHSLLISLAVDEMVPGRNNHVFA